MYQTKVNITKLWEVNWRPEQIQTRSDYDQTCCVSVLWMHRKTSHIYGKMISICNIINI